jgi:hypothetical protein
VVFIREREIERVNPNVKEMGKDLNQIIAELKYQRARNGSYDLKRTLSLHEFKL